MTTEDTEKLMNTVFQECYALRKAGQAEYAHNSANAFSNFDRVSERLGISSKAVLMVYAEKHIDGIHSYIQGYESQRENIRGRINDLIVYMCLLRGMIEEQESREAKITFASEASRIKNEQLMNEARPRTFLEP